MRQLRAFQREDVEFLKRNNLRALVASAPGTGKAQPLDAKVLTPTGWCAIGKLQVGDTVLDPDGGVGLVEGVFPQGKKQIFRVTTASGASTECCADHLWLVQSRNDRRRDKPFVVRPTRDLLETRVQEGASAWTVRKWFLPVAQACEFEVSSPLPLDPYVLGALLGDGGFSDSQLRFSNVDAEIIDKMQRLLPCPYRLKPKKSSTCDFTVVAEGKRPRASEMRRLLTLLGLWGKRSEEKFVPSAYLFASSAERLELLRGLMDTDGTVSKGKASFTSTSESLAKAVAQLTRSLGGLASITTRVPSYTYKGERKNGRTCWNVWVRLPTSPFSTSRKAALWRPDLLANGIESIVPSREAEAVCIRVSTKRHLYVTDDFIITHNTPVALRAIAEKAPNSLPALVVAPASVVRNWQREAYAWVPGMTVHIIEEIAAPIPPPTRNTLYVTSWALLDAKCSDIMKLGIRCVVADEAHFSKNPEALRSKALYDIASSAPGCMLLTGTPIINTQQELQALNALLGSDNPPMIRRLLEDVAPDIPRKKRSYLHVAMREAHQSEYDRAVRNFEEWLRKEKEKLLGEGMAEVEVERALAAESLVKIGYLRRLAGEFKVPAAADWIARAVRIGEPVVVFVEHQAVLSKLSKALKKQRIRHVVIEGATSPKKRQAAIDSFQANKFPVFIGTKAAKEGITLTAARHLLFVERFYTSAEEEQAEDRIRRIGQTYPTTIWFLHAMGTIDDRIDTIVRHKRVIVREAIGSANVLETPIGNVQALIRAWDDHAAPKHAALNLGTGEPLLPLPRPSDTHGVVFYGDRWKSRSAQAWCQMHGYSVGRRVHLNGRFKLVVHPAEVFRKGSFDTIRVCRDIRIIVGKRLSRDNERRVRSGLRG